MLDAALKIAAEGIPVFPCGPDKAPRVAGGFKAASTDPDTIRAMPWSDDSMIGAVVPSHQIVVDVDPRNGGDETMALFPGLPTSRTVRTKSNGTHIYLTIPQDIGPLRGTLGPGVDVKQHGKGYVIVPPSEGYRYIRGGPALPAPDWLLDELKVAERAQAHEPSEPKFFARFEQGTPYGLGALDKQLGRLMQAQPGERNNALNKAAFSLAQLAAGGELDWEWAHDMLSQAGGALGLEDEEIQKTIESGRLAGEQEPWQAPALTPPQSVHSTLHTSAPAEVTWMDWTADEPDFPFYVWPILPKNAYVLVYGATEASKSMSMVGILCQSSHRGVKSSVYSLENPPATDRKRISRWAPDPEHFRITNDSIDFSDPRQVEALIEREKAWGTDVVMIDTYSHAFTSRSDDGNAKAIAFAQVVRHVMAEVGCSVIVVDHTGFVGDEPRDASAKRQQVDVAVLMKKAGEWRPGAPSRFTMENKKAARFSNPFNLVGEIRDGADNALELGWIGDHPRWEGAA